MMSIDEQIRIIAKGADEIIGIDDLRGKFEKSQKTGRPLIVKLGLDPTAPDIHLGELVVDTNRKRATLGGKPVPLTAREYQLLEYLAHHRGTVVSRTRLWEHVWESGNEPDSNVVDVYIRYLRNKLGHERIQTLRGMGYLLRDDEGGGKRNEASRVDAR